MFLDIFEKENILYSEYSDTVYIYQNEEWIGDDTNCALKVTVQDVLLKLFKKYLSDKFPNAPIQLPRKNAKKKDNEPRYSEADILNIQFLKKCIDKIGNTHQISGVVKDIRDRLFTEHSKKPPVYFDVGSEQYKNIHFKNGVLDVETGLFRKRTRDDLVTMTLDYNYRPASEVSQESHDFVREVFNQIHVDQEQREDSLSFLKTLLKGGNSNSYFKINQGQGGNGKTMEMTIHKACLPLYTLFVNKKALEGPDKDRYLYTPSRTPVRALVGEEITAVDDIKLYSDLGEKEMKRLYSNRLMKAKMQYTMVLSTNETINFPSVDGGILRRACQQMYLSKFTDSCDTPDYKNKIFPTDKFLEDKFLKNVDNKLAYMHLLLLQKEFDPSRMQQRFMNEVFQQDEIILAFEKHFIKTNNYKDRVYKEDVYNLINTSQYRHYLTIQLSTNV